MFCYGYLYADLHGDVNVFGVECFELFKMVYDNRFTMAIRFIVYPSVFRCMYTYTFIAL